MLGEDTVVFTKKGFKKVKDLVIYDEVLTPFGDFEPIIEMGPWCEMTTKVNLDGVEDIYCDDNLLWHKYFNTNCYTDELEPGDSTSPINFELVGDGRNRLSFNPYDYAVVIPTHVPTEIMLGNIHEKLDFLAGLIDSPMCELGNLEGAYNFYFDVAHKQLFDEIFAFVRSLSLGALRKYYNGLYRITVYITKYADILPVRDDLKACYDYASVGRVVSIKEISDLSINDKKLGRKIKVNRGYFLAGYGLVPVC